MDVSERKDVGSPCHLFENCRSSTGLIQNGPKRLRLLKVADFGYATKKSGLALICGSRESLTASFLIDRFLLPKFWK